MESTAKLTLPNVLTLARFLMIVPFAMYAMAGDDKGRIWVAETGVRPNRLVAFDPAAGKFTETADTEGGDQPNTVRHMVFSKPTREIWYGTDRNTIGRLKVP